MRKLLLPLALVLGQSVSAFAADVLPPASSSPVVFTTPTTLTTESTSSLPALVVDGSAGGSTRGLFESDHAFDGFIGPMSNPILSKDPRSLTEARVLFVDDTVPGSNPFGGGTFQVYAIQARLALTDRLTLIADKDGIATLHFKNAPSETGLLNLNAGLKYALIRDVENQFLLTAGVMFEVPTGYAKLYQNQGDGIFTAFLSSGKEIAETFHVLGNVGYQFPVNTNQNSSFIYTQLHLDAKLFERFYPMVEANWYHYLSGGNHGLPHSIGEVDGLINLGTSGMSGTDLVTIAAGVKFKVNSHLEIGGVYELPISNPEDFLSRRIVADIIFRY